MYEGEFVGKFFLRDYIQKYRNKLLKIRGHYCQNCHKFIRKENLYMLHMHHIDRDRWNNCRQNVIFLCRKCHQETHSTEDFKNDNEESVGKTLQ